MVNKTQYNLTKDQAEKVINMCLENARSYLDDADMYISKDRTEHLAIPIVFAMEEIGKAKIIFDKMLDNDSKISLSYKDGIYNHVTKTKKTISMVEIDLGEEVADKIAEDLILGDYAFDYTLDQKTIWDNIVQEIELKNTGKKGHDLRLASSYVDFDSNTNEPKIKKSSGDLTKLLNSLSQIIREYPSSFNTHDYQG